MKKGIYLLFILLCFSQLHGLSQPIGFAQLECGIIQNPNYYYQNYDVPPHGRGCRLYHNGNIIYQCEDGYNSFDARELKFIDDTTGFFSIYCWEIDRLAVLKIINNSVLFIGYGDGEYFDSFVASRHTIYITGHPQGTGNFYLFLTRLSDLSEGKVLLFAGDIIPDTTLYDTILGIPLCQELNKLDYLYKHSNDTIVATISLTTDPLVYISALQEFTIRIMPNPASAYIHIFSSAIEKRNSIQILDILGRKKKYLKSDNICEQLIYIGDLNNGVYFLIIENGIEKRVTKFIKI
jgi:hypothetical protein